MNSNANKLKGEIPKSNIISRWDRLYYMSILLLLVFAACSKDNPGEEGTYDLQTVDGSALPFDEVVPPPYIREISYVLILNGGMYTQTRTRLFGSQTPSTISNSGSYTVSSSGTISLINASTIGPVGSGDVTGSLSGSVLTLMEGSSGHVLIFDKR